MVVDSHQHFWTYDPVEFDWIDESMAAIRRDYLPADLEHAFASAQVDGSIAVQARMSLAETDWLLALASCHPRILGVVGWVPLAEACVRGDLERFSANPKFRGCRHVVQGQPPGFLLDPGFNAGIELLKEFDLTYDILIYENQLREAAEFVRRHPEQIFILDHCAKPRIRDGEIEPWKSNLRALAAMDNVSCKLSGLVTEAAFGCRQPGELRPYIEIALEAFGTNRVMFGSDWPVCLTSSSYQAWHGAARDALSGLTSEEQARIFGLNALETYKLIPL